jgi:hypothetical protein
MCRLRAAIKQRLRDADQGCSCSSLRQFASQDRQRSVFKSGFCQPLQHRPGRSFVMGG